MNKKTRSCIIFALVGCWAACTPLAVPPIMSAVEKQQTYEKERYPVKVVYDPAAPQAVSGFFRMGRVASDNMSSSEVLSYTGNLRDLEMIVNTVNQYTEVRAEITPSLTYSDPRLFNLPIIVPQNLPNEVELEQLTKYLLAGGFVLDASLLRFGM